MSLHLGIQVQLEEPLHCVEYITLLLRRDTMARNVEEARCRTGIVDLGGNLLAVFDVRRVDGGDVYCRDRGKATLSLATLSHFAVGWLGAGMKVDNL